MVKLAFLLCSAQHQASGISINITSRGKSQSYKMLPVQNFGSSLKSPQWSMPSQYLSNGRHDPLPLHANSSCVEKERRKKRTRFNLLAACERGNERTTTAARILMHLPEILHDSISMMKFNNIMPQAPSISHRMICKTTTTKAGKAKLQKAS